MSDSSMLLGGPGKLQGWRLLARGSYGRRMAMTALLTVLADWLFYGWDLGISVLIFAVCVAAAAALAAPVQPRRKTMAILLLILAVAVAPVVAGVGLISVSFALLGTAYVAASLGESQALSWGRMPAALRLLRQIFWRIYPDGVAAGITGLPALRRIYDPASLLTWVLPLGFGGLFLSLFSAANPVIQNDLNAFNPLNIWASLSFNRLVFWLLAAGFVWPFVALSRRPNKAVRAVRTRLKVRGLWAVMLGKAAILRSLAVFNLLFAIQTGLDIFYLWCGGKLPAGISYADYAHRGAYPLILTALLAGAFAIAATNPGTEAAKSRVLKILVLLWIGQNLLLVVSSIRRLDLYVQVYSLTELRFAALIWMLLVAAGLVLILWRIIYNGSNRWLIRANVIALAFTLYGWAFTNMPGLVAMYDVKHCREITGAGAPLDLGYIDRLGPQAIPALDWFEVRSVADAGASAIFLQTGRVGQERQTLLSDVTNASRNWRGWNLWSWVLNCYLATHKVTYLPGGDAGLR
jgi:hypothetical protein